ncbi:MAG: hypothetical protein ACRC8A_13295 [Microcoleaceae cyanobacterium]
MSPEQAELLDELDFSESGIAEREGISRQEVRELREAAKDTETGGISGKIKFKPLKLGVTLNPKGEIGFSVGAMSVSSRLIGCFWVTSYSIAGIEVYSNIARSGLPGCEEPPPPPDPKKPPRPKEPTWKDDYSPGDPRDMIQVCLDYQYFISMNPKVIPSYEWTPIIFEKFDLATAAFRMERTTRGRDVLCLVEQTTNRTRYESCYNYRGGLGYYNIVYDLALGERFIISPSSSALYGFSQPTRPGRYTIDLLGTKYQLIYDPIGLRGTRGWVNQMIPTISRTIKRDIAAEYYNYNVTRSDVATQIVDEWVFEKFPSTGVAPAYTAKRPEKMDCCDLVRKMYKRIGCDLYPGKMPISLTGGADGKLNPNDQIEITNLTGLLLHVFKLDDERWGQFPIDIQIEDSDQTQEGSQTYEIRLPNAAEALAEIYGLLMNMQSDSDVNQSYAARTLAEVGLTRIAARQAYEAIRQVIEYLGFDYQKIESSMKFTFTPGAEEVDQVLKESTQSYQSIKIADEEKSLKEVLADLLNAAAIIRATQFRKVNPKGDMKQQILNNLRRGVDMYQKLENLKTDGKLGWKEFVDKTQDNWTTDTDKSNNPIIQDYKAPPATKT